MKNLPMKDFRASGRKAPSLAPGMLIVYPALDRLKPDPHPAAPQQQAKPGGSPTAARPMGSNFPILIDRNGNVIAVVNEPANKVRFPSTTRGSG